MVTWVCYQGRDDEKCTKICDKVCNRLATLKAKKEMWHYESGGCPMVGLALAVLNIRFHFYTAC